MDDLDRLRLELAQLREELAEQRRWSTEARHRAEAFGAETSHAITQLYHLIEASRCLLVGLKSKDQS